jgi:hypothetical protein
VIGRAAPRSAAAGCHAGGSGGSSWSRSRITEAM